MTWVAGGAPQSSAGPGEDEHRRDRGDPPWPVQVGLSERAAFALDLAAGRPTHPGGPVRPGDRRPGQRHLLPGQPGRPGLAVARELLSPAVGSSDGVERTSVAALVSPEALPDLRLAVPSDELTQRITFLPDRSGCAGSSRRTCVATWSSSRPRPAWPAVRSAGTACWTGCSTTRRRQVASARGQAQVLLVGLLATRGADARPRRPAVGTPPRRLRSRSRASGGRRCWASAPSSTIESLLVAVAGTAVGVAVTAALVGSAAWTLGAAGRRGGGARRAGARHRRGRPGHRASVGCPPTAPLDVPRSERRQAAAGRCWRRRCSGWPASPSSPCSNAARSRAT